MPLILSAWVRFRCNSEDYTFLLIHDLSLPFLIYIFAPPHALPSPLYLVSVFFYYDLLFHLFSCSCFLPNFCLTPLGQYFFALPDSYFSLSPLRHYLFSFLFVFVSVVYGNVNLSLCIVLNVVFSVMLVA